MSDRSRCPVVFVVDDEPLIALTLAMVLQSSGFDATSFTDPFEALRAAHFGAPDLILSDVMMPFLSGIDLAAKVKAFRPDCKVLLLSGEAALVDHLMDDSPLQERFEILQKPVRPAALVQRIEGLLDLPSNATLPRLIDQNSAPKRPAQGLPAPRQAYKKA